uniref:hypothetical protein n=1 Tax=Yersinia kristensenii TaxID=28152 RepID=UPI000B007030
MTNIADRTTHTTSYDTTFQSIIANSVRESNLAKTLHVNNSKHSFSANSAFNTSDIKRGLSDVLNAREIKDTSLQKAPSGLGMPIPPPEISPENTSQSTKNEPCVRDKINELLSNSFESSTKFQANKLEDIRLTLTKQADDNKYIKTFLLKWDECNNESAKTRVESTLKMIAMAKKSPASGEVNNGSRSIDTLEKEFLTLVGNNGMNHGSYASGSSSGSIKEYIKFNRLCEEIALQTPYKENRYLNEIAEKIVDIIDDLPDSSEKNQLKDTSGLLLFRNAIIQHDKMMEYIDSQIFSHDKLTTLINHETIILDLLKNWTTDKNPEAAVPGEPDSFGPQPQHATPNTDGPVPVIKYITNNHYHYYGSSGQLPITITNTPSFSPVNNPQFTQVNKNESTPVADNNSVNIPQDDESHNIQASNNTAKNPLLEPGLSTLKPKQIRVPEPKDIVDGTEGISDSKI